MSLKEKLRNFFEPPVVDKVRILIRMAKEFGLHDQDIRNAEEMLHVNEWRVAFDTLVTQMYEFEVAVTSDFLQLAQEIMVDMRIDEQEYDFLIRLPRKDSVE